MAKIIGIDLGTTYSAVSVWDDKKKEAVILENLRGNRTTPSVVSFNKAGELIVGEDAKQNLWVAPEDTASQIKREMGTDFHVTMRGVEYNPQTISAFILRYLKQCAEAKLGEPVYDAVITVPAYFKEVQRSATRDAGIMAGLNVHQLINEPTATAIAFGLEKHVPGEHKIYAVYDLGGGNFNVSIVEIGNEIIVLGTGGDPRLGGLDMDEAVMKWSLRQIRQQYGPDLSADESVRRRLKLEAEQIKKTLVVSETAWLNVPFLTIVDGKPLNIDLSISRAQFEMLIMPLLQRSIDCWEQAVIAAKEANQIDWEDVDGVLVVGGPTRLHKIREMLRDTLKKHNPDKEPEIRTDINPDEVVAMGAAIVAGTLTPFGVPPGTVESKKEQAQEAHKAKADAAGTVVPEVVFFDVTGHSLGIAIDGVRFHRLINKDTPIPVKVAEQGFSNPADYATQQVIEVYQGENEYVAANTKIGEIRIEGLESLPAGQHIFQVEFILDLSGTLTTICTDMRTKKQYTGSFVFKDFTRVSQEEIQKKQRELEALMPDKVGGTGTPSTGATPPIPLPGPAEAPAAVPQLPVEKIPAEWRVYWMESLEQVTKLGPTQRAVLLRAMNTFARAVMGGNPALIEDSAYLLQDTLVEIHTVDEPLQIPLKPVRHPEVPGAVDRVHFSVTAPPAVPPGASFVVDIWAHLEQQRQEVIQRAKAAVGGRDVQIKTKGPLPISRGTVLAVHLKIDGMLIEDPQDTILWEGEIGSASFAVQVPRDAPIGLHLGRAAIYADGVQIARIHFELEVAAQPVEARSLTLQEKRFRTAFASYASPDRDLVLRCVQGMEKAAPSLDIFMDVHSLRSGQKWEQELWQRIPACDIFFLFWSANASQSPWVEKEWRCALAAHGIDFIDPVPLEPPDVAPPPAELAGLHFNDWELAYQRGQQQNHR